MRRSSHSTILSAVTVLLFLCPCGTPLPAAVYNLKVVTDASPDYHDMDGMIHSITSRWPEPEQKCWAMFYWNHIAQWRRISPNYYGDFHPLTPWTRDATAWMAWQFDRPEAGEGMVQVFRRHNSFYESARFKLLGLDAQADYLVSNIDTGVQERRSGRQLLNDGLPVTLADKPGAAVLVYRKQ